MLQFYSASTSVVDSKRAITECLENALAGEKTLICDLLIIYTAMGHNFKELLSEAHRLCPDARVVGCTCAGIIGREGPNESLKALAIMAIKGTKKEFAVTGMDSVVNQDSFEFGRKMANDLKDQNNNINLLLFHPPTGFAGIDRTLAGIESVFGPEIPIIGGASIDNMKFVSNYQFVDNKIFERGAIMVGLADPTLELISHSNHGFDIIGDPFVVTRSDLNTIFELDGKNAWKKWTERLGMPVTSSPADVLVFAPFAMELPSELHKEYGSRYRIVGALPLPDGSLFGLSCTEGTRLWLSRRNEARIHDGVERLMVKILDRCDGRLPVAVFHADCAARGRMMFNRIMKEEIVSQLQFPLCRGENIPWLGMFGGTEFSPLKGKNMIHQYTTSLFVLVRKKEEVKQEKTEYKTDIVKRSRLFERTTIRNLPLKNRFIYSATWQGKANFDGSTSPTLIRSLLPVARGEAGLIIGEMAYVSQNGIAVPGHLGIYDDKLIPGLRRMADFVHDAGIPIILQLMHGGLFSSPLLIGGTPVGPSVLATPEGKIGREMSKEEITEIVNAFSAAAVRAKEAGFDGIQVHAGHGWLLSQFLSPFFNRRTDEYGGSLKNRSRIVVEITRRIREVVGDNFPITVKINSDDFILGGFNTDEMLQVSEMLEKERIDAIEVSGGTIGALMSGNVDGSFSPATKKGVYYQEAAKRYKEKIKVPLILVGGIRAFETADDLVKSGIADYISLCRPLIREPDLIKKWKSGNLKKSDCISDSACFQPGIEGKGVHCVHVKD
ncbi:MAG: FIST C-terminal domain-containing protein [Bacteroidia bacterium]|nr:FIST C-terminal domain-containing protein [Bacteroidia bacterium]